MRYNVRQYGEALLGALDGKREGGRKEVVKRFLSLLRKNHDSGKLSRIIQEMERRYLRVAGLRKVEITAASPLGANIKKELKEIFGKEMLLEEKVNPEILAGMRILVDEELFIDASAKRRLEEILH